MPARKARQTALLQVQGSGATMDLSAMASFALRVLTVQSARYSSQSPSLCEIPFHLNRPPVLQGKAALPYPKPDYWAAANAHTNGTLMIHDSPGVDAILEDPPYFLPCSSGRCLGNFQCQPGYTGVQCSVCEPGQFFFQGKCDISCADIEPKAVVTVFGIGAVVCVWLILNFVPSKSAHLCCAAPRMFGVVHPVMLRGPTVRSASLCRRFPSLNVGVS